MCQLKSRSASTAYATGVIIWRASGNATWDINLKHRTELKSHEISFPHYLFAFPDVGEESKQ